MATTAGTDGFVKLSTNDIAEVKSWTLDQTLEILDASVLGTSGNRVKQASFRDWKGTLECFWDPTDTNGQVAINTAMANGTTVSIVLQPEGEDTGDTQYTGTAFISSVSYSGAFDNLVTATIAFEGSGALTTSTIPA